VTALPVAIKTALTKIEKAFFIGHLYLTTPKLTFACQLIRV
jgi:hypothetical protein